MKRFAFGALALSLAVGIAASLVTDTVEKKETVFQAGDEDIILSDMPITFYAGLQ